MEENQTASGETAQVSDSVETQEDKVSYASFKKLLGEKKARDGQLNELKEKLAMLEADKLAAEGNKDKLIENYKTRLAETESKLKESSKKFVENRLTDQMKSAALKAGCSYPDDLMRLLSKDDLEQVSVDDSYNVDQKALSIVIDKYKKEKPYLFKTDAAKIADMPPTNGNFKDKKTDLTKLSREDMNKLIWKLERS